MASERGKAIYRSLAELIGGRPSVHRWESDNFPGMSVDILQGSGWPAPSDRVAATLNLSNEPGVDAYAVRADSLGLPLVPPRIEPPMVFLALLPLTDVELAWVESVGPEPFLIASAAIDLLDFGRQGIGPV